MNRLSRIWHSFRLTLCKGSARKKAYADKHELFAYFGEGVVFQPHLIPLYSKLIKIHDNVVIGRNVEFVTHDVLHRVFNSSSVGVGQRFRERVGCIEVMDGSFVGNGAFLMYGVRIAENNIIAAGSVVTRSTEPNAVYAGVPARKIGVYSETLARRLAQEREGSIPTISRNQNMTSAEVDNAWRIFGESNARFAKAAACDD